MPDEVSIKPRMLEIMLLGSSIDRLNRVGSGEREEDYYQRIERNFDLRIIGYSHSTGLLAENELPVVNANKWIQSVFGPLQLLRIQWKPSIIRTKQLWGSWTGWLAKLVTGAPLIIRCGYIWSKSYEIERKGIWSNGRNLPGMIERWMIRRGNAYIFSSDEVREFYSPLINERKSVVIPNTFNLEIFKPYPEAEKLYDYIYVGRLIELKGVSLMLDLLPENRRILVIGAGKLSNKVNNHPGVTLVSFVSNYKLPVYLNQARCFISLSRTEGHPKAVYEAVLCGLYPILSDIPAHKALIDELGYGTIISADGNLPINEELTINYEKLESFRKQYCMEFGIEREMRFIKEVLTCFSC